MYKYNQHISTLHTSTTTSNETSGRIYLLFYIGVTNAILHWKPIVLQRVIFAL